MKEKILAFLKSKLTGVSESYLLGVAETWSKTITDEKAIETTLSEGVIETIKFSALELQKVGDKRATEALKTFREKHGLNEDGTPIKKEDKKEGVTDPNEPAWFTAYKKEQAEQTAALRTKLENQEKEKASAALIDKVKAHPKLKDIPASFLNGRNLVPASEAEIDQLATSIEATYNSFKQEMVEKGIIVSAPPTGGGNPGDKSTIDGYLDEKFPKESPKV
jgi:hypothetical protein